MSRFSLTLAFTLSFTGAPGRAAVHFIPLEALACGADLKSARKYLLEDALFRVEGQTMLKHVEALTAPELDQLASRLKALVPADLLSPGRDVLFDFNTERQTGGESGLISGEHFDAIETFASSDPVFARWRVYVDAVLRATKRHAELADKRLKIVSAQLRYRPALPRALVKQEAKMHLDGGSLAVIVTWLGHATVTKWRDLHLEVPRGVPFLLTGTDHRAGRPATWHGEPLGTPGERLIMVLRLEPQNRSPWTRASRE